jgi:RNA polymerase sigma-70 factor (ECF subfamily)
VTPAEIAFQQMLESARRGDSRAFEQLYLRLNRRVHAFVRVRGATDPEGTVNDVFLAVFTRLGSFEGEEGQFNAWVFTIARNKLIDESRKRQRRVREVSADRYDVEHIVAGRSATGDVEQEVIDHITTEGLSRKLQLLTDDQRDAVVLRVIADLGIEAIAGVMDKTPGAVRALLRRAFRTIDRVGLPMVVQL